MPTVTATQSQLPISSPIKIVQGDTFRSQIFRHKRADGTYIDTSSWTFPVAAIFERQACGAAKVIDMTVEQQPGPQFGYRVTLTEAQTAGLTCADNWYKIQTDDGTTEKTYVNGPAKITGVG